MKGKSHGITTNIASLTELLKFVWHGKTWWLTPLIVVLAALSAVVVFLEASAIAPFIYALF